MKKLLNSLTLATVIATVCLLCSCNRAASYYEESNAALLKQVELYRAYYNASESFISMCENSERVINGHDWDDTYYESEEAQDLFEAKANLEDMLKHIPEDTTCVYMPSYDDLIKERNLLWDLLQVTAVQDTVAWETKVKKLPEWKEYDKFLLHDWEDMEFWKHRPVDLKYEELSEE